MNRNKWPLVAIVVLTCGRCAVAQTAPVPCKARQLEVYREGGDAGLGHGRQIVGLRNVSDGLCTLSGVPRLEFFDKAGKRLAIPYGKNEADYMFEQQPEKPVRLAPGDFAYFMIGTTHGDGTYRYHAMHVLLPGDGTPLLEEGAGGAEDSISVSNVSAFVAGVNGEDGFETPSREIPVAGGGQPDLALTLHVPDRPKGPFDAHFTLVNKGMVPVRIYRGQCSLSGQLTNSAGKVVWESEDCTAWSGIDAIGLLKPGARASADIQVGDVALQMCREGEWKAQLSLNLSSLSTGTVRFAEFPFEVVHTQCSDSEHVGDYVDENSIHWMLVPQHGVRLGVAVRGKDGAGPTMAPFSGKNPRFLVPQFHAGDRIPLRFYLDNLIDSPLEWSGGANTVRVAVRASGKSAMLAPGGTAQGTASDVREVVLPHSWRYVQSVTLSDLYDLGPGSYDVIAGMLGLRGDAAAANSPATGWPYTEGSAMVALTLKIVP